MEKEFYTIPEAVEELGRSHVTVYKKLKLKEFKKYKKKIKGETVIEAEGLELIRDSLKRSKADIKEEVNKEEEIKTDIFEIIKLELQEKNRQIEKLQKMLGDMQVLLLNEQRKDNKLIESKDTSKFKILRKIFKSS